ncbi:peroxiredoxin [Flavobacterium sp. ANB]|uniref:peroxiredoxin n=1 Tax=unclassified Flavobacterium TaxID=196869 RepID=UPI0012B7BD38|nr:MULTISPECIES: peroxiredoxin [unclassified Flavobacterium]MBF4517884.1 peroxiredoxin [Flavobacterium sp. ANB]MTD72046.1 redoxin domain-containing protein [Flavobacterium sp. LC2016-13]
MIQELKVGDKIPNFSLQDQNGQLFNSATDVIGTTSVIYFYPKDESGVCTKEACAFRDSFQDFTDAGIQVLGINAAGIESHKKFAEKNRLPFKLLSDPGNKVIKQFGVKNALFLTGRETFIVNESGVVIHKFRDFFKGAAHAKEVLEFLKPVK